MRNWNRNTGWGRLPWGRSLWTPKNVRSATLKDWYRGDYGIGLVSGEVDTWTPKFGSDVLSALGAGNRGIDTTFQGRRAVKCQTSDGLLAVLGSEITQPYTIWMVGSGAPATDAVRYPLLSVNSTNLSGICYSLNAVVMGIKSGTLKEGTARLIDNVPGIYEMVVNGATSTLKTNGYTSVSGDAGSSTMSRLAIGVTGDGSTRFIPQASYAEIIVFEGALSDADRADMISYLTNRYSLSMVWNPLEYLSTMFYYDAELGVTKDESDKVSAWADQSVHGYNQAQANGDLQPIWTADQLNGLPVIVFNGIDDYMQSTFGATYAQPNTIVLVGKWVTKAGLEVCLDGIDNNNFNSLRDRNLNKYALFAGNNVNSATLITGNYETVVAIFNGASSEIILDGVSIMTDNPGNKSTTGLTIGAGYDGSSPANIFVAALFGFNRAADATLLAAIAAHVNSRWGL
jgi:hypothetical protein